MTVVANSHIFIDDQNVARVDGSRMKVVHLVKEMLARKATVDQLRDSFPELSLAQIHAALSYYYDHKPQFDAEIEREAAEFDQAKLTSTPTSGRDKLRKTGDRP
jgi:uncharacterized protein (DUF433 family)